MTQSTIHTNGHGPMTATTGPDRRQTTEPDEPVSPEALVERHIESARRQLAEARERLKAARRRVVQLEDAVCNWERFATDLRQYRDNGHS
jgi:hypothetical protein